jgi:hypothetical protein
MPGPDVQCLQRGRILSCPPTSQTVNEMFLYSTVSTLNPEKGDWVSYACCEAVATCGCLQRDDPALSTLNQRQGSARRVLGSCTRLRLAPCSDTTPGRRPCTAAPLHAPPLPALAPAWVLDTSPACPDPMSHPPPSQRPNVTRHDIFHIMPARLPHPSLDSRYRSPRWHPSTVAQQTPRARAPPFPSHSGARKPQFTPFPLSPRPAVGLARRLDSPMVGIVVTISPSLSL